MATAKRSIRKKTTQKAEQQTDWDYQDVDIERSGSRIILPAKPEAMPLDDAIAALYRKKEDEEQFIDNIEYIKAFPLDGAVAFLKAMQHTFGWASPVPTPGWFGDNPPKMVGVEIGVDETTQVPFGRFEIPNVEGYLETSVGTSPSGDPCFMIVGHLKKKDSHIAMELAESTKEFVKNESIYRGKALLFRTDKEGTLDPRKQPTFLDTSKIDTEELILNEDVKEYVNTSVFVPVTHTQKCRDAGIPLNRSVLLEGIYGVGKTMIARMVSKLCEDNGWTFLLLDRTTALTDALMFAQRYSPAVIFGEDIDRITNTRDEAANDLLNTIDGIVTKDSEVVAIMTTNHVEKISKPMLRPGRLDAVITVSPPDKESVKKLIHLYGRGLVPLEENLDEVGELMKGEIPATIREVVERSKLRAIPKMNGSGLILTQENLLYAAKEMKEHLKLLNKGNETMPTPMEEIVSGFSRILKETQTDESVTDINKMMTDVSKKVARIYQRIM